MSIPEPVYVRDLFGGKATVIAFGAPFNWNYAGTSREEMEAKNPGITAALEEVMRRFDIQRALVPKPSFDANVVTEHDLPNELLPNFCRGADADGVILTKPDDAYFLASADCLATLIYDDRTGALSANHCGRESIIDKKAILAGLPQSREFPSIIDAAIKRLDQLAGERLKPIWMPQDFSSYEEIPPHLDHTGLQVFLAAGIRPETFEHPTVDHKFAAENKLMIDALVRSDLEHASQPGNTEVVTNAVRGNIDLFALVRRQLLDRDVQASSIIDDGYDTATTTDEQGNPLFQCNRLDPTRSKRNLIIVRLN